MIRRGFWLVVGAAGGIMGYRRAVSLGRSLSGTLMLTRGTEPEPQNPQGGPPRGPRSPSPRGAGPGPGLARRAFRLTRDVRRFGRDVREGMDLYLTRHPGQPGPTLGAGHDNDERVKDDR